jgi:peptide/nickel transport system permease protein
MNVNVLAEKKKERLDRLAAAAEAGGVSLWRDALRRLRRNPVAIVGAVIVALFLLMAIFAPLLAPKSPTIEYLKGCCVRLSQGEIPGPRAGFPLGTDAEGRDFLSRLIYGSRQTLFVGVLATLIGLSVGVVLGSVAGAVAGWVDNVIMRVVDVLLALPSLLLAVTLVALVSRPNQWTVILAVAIVNIPIFARLLRGSMLAQRESDHVLAARALGVRQRSVVLRHMLPNALSPVIVQATLTLATAILDAAALSFLGLGDQDFNRAEWGIMLGGEGQQFFGLAPRLAYYPAIAIIIVALGFTLLGESMREALDPKNRR